MGLGTIVALAIGSCAPQSVSPEPLQLGIAIYTRADIDGPIVARAKDRVDRIFREVGISVIWKHEVPSRTNTITEVGIIIQPRVLPHRSGPAGELGVAIDAPSERGRLAYVFFEQVLATAQKHRVDEGALLGHAIAHEAGHLLLPFGTHSTMGLMRGEWEESDFAAIAGRGLSLTAEQATAIRRRLLESHR
jgi:hypothetical protein